MAFNEFCEEAEHEPPHRNDDWDKFSHIEVSGSIELAPMPSYERVPKRRVAPENGLLKEYDLRAALGLGEPRTTDLIRLTLGWSKLAILKTPEWDETISAENRGYSVAMSPISDWAQLPIVIDRKLKMLDRTPWDDKKHLSTDELLLNPLHPLIRSNTSRGGQIVSCETDILSNDSFHAVIVRGCLRDWGFHYDPALRDRTARKIQEMMTSIADDKGTIADTDDTADREHESRVDLIHSIMAADEAVFVRRRSRQKEF